jgi:hypothetical protein
MFLRFLLVLVLIVFAVSVVSCVGSTFGSKRRVTKRVRWDSEVLRREGMESGMEEKGVNGKKGSKREDRDGGPDLDDTCLVM